jgi:hypothetical protein
MRIFFSLVALAAAAVLWKAYPSMVHRQCPVCLGQGRLTLRQPLVEVKRGEPVERRDILCPFCQGGRLSLAELRGQEANILRWMVKDQQLKGDELVRRVRDAYGEEGLRALKELTPQQP